MSSIIRGSSRIVKVNSSRQLARCGTTLRPLRTCANVVREMQTTSKPPSREILLSHASESRSHTKCMTSSQARPPNEGQELCGRVAGLLNEAGVGNLLWATNLMAAYTVPMCLTELTFLVTDGMLQKAIATLESDGLQLCRDESCRLNKPRGAEDMSFWNLYAHFHLPVTDVVDEDWATLRLHAMDDMLWELPAHVREVGCTDGAHNNVIFANDASLAVGTELQGAGRFPDSIPGVRIPTLHRYIEGLILLVLSAKPGISTLAWVSELAFVAELVDLNRLSHPAFKMFCYRVLGGHDFKDMIRDGQKALGHRTRKDTYWNDVQAIRATWKEHTKCQAAKSG